MPSLSPMDRTNKFVLTSVLLCIIFHISTTSATDKKESPTLESLNFETMCKWRTCSPRFGSRHCNTYIVKCRFGCCGGVGEERCCTRAEAFKKKIDDDKKIVNSILFNGFLCCIFSFFLGVMIVYLTYPRTVLPVAVVQGQANDKLLRRRTSVGSRYFPWKAAGDNTPYN